MVEASHADAVVSHLDDVRAGAHAYGAFADAPGLDAGGRFWRLRLQPVHEQFEQIIQPLWTTGTLEGPFTNPGV